MPDTAHCAILSKPCDKITFLINYELKIRKKLIEIEINITSHMHKSLTLFYLTYLNIKQDIQSSPTKKIQTLA